MKIIIMPNSPLSIYEQIVNQMKDAIVKKDLVAGEALPSIRALAKELSVSVITTKKAYEVLEAEGIITSVAGKGFYVCELNREILKEKQTMLLEGHFAQLIEDAKAAGLSLSEVIDLVTVLYKNE